MIHGAVWGNDSELAARPVVVRTDSTGAATGSWPAAASATSASRWWPRSTAQVHTAISRAHADDDRWSPAVRPDGEVRDDAQVAEHLVDLSAWPVGTRLVVRRERLHPGAQHTLFPSLAYRYWTGATAPTRPATPSPWTRPCAHAHVDDNMHRLKDSGLCRFPFAELDANRAWLATVCFADALVRWFQLLVVSGPLAKAEPKTLRWRLWHTPARIVRHAQIVRVLDAWPDADTLTAAYQRITTLC